VRSPVFGREIRVGQVYLIPAGTPVYRGPENGVWPNYYFEAEENREVIIRSVMTSSYSDVGTTLAFWKTPEGVEEYCRAMHLVGPLSDLERLAHCSLTSPSCGGMTSGTED